MKILLLLLSSIFFFCCAPIATSPNSCYGWYEFKTIQDWENFYSDGSTNDPIEGIWMINLESYNKNSNGNKTGPAK